MKILMLGWELPPHNSGGLGVACYNLCKALSKNDVDIEFIIPYAGPYKADFMNVRSVFTEKYNDVTNRLEIYESNKYSTETAAKYQNISYQLDKYVEAVGKIVEEAEFDIIHAHDWLTFRAALRAKEISGKPLILHLHSLESDRAGGAFGNPFIKEIEETIVHFADQIITVSEKTKNQIIEEYGIPGSKISVIYNSIDIESSLFEDNTENAYRYVNKLKDNGYRVVVNVGRMTIMKGLPNLLYAAKEVIARVPKSIFLLVGDGDQFVELLQLAASLGISQNVIFSGFQRGKKWRDAFIVGDLFVMPSVSEPFGLTPLEAASYKTPSLLSKQTGVTEILVNCLKVDYWDVAEMANQITAVLKNPTLSNELSKNAYTEYTRLGASSSVEELLDIYKRHLEMAVV